ncbi:hypothetical protein ILYODFUR_016874 [Ilyodon furcidens]|uniref:Uncharacterized protein n=1 Tax=Ilyodon furcidens TaxID=33524 RepID=A0ABV0V3P0_9TELE
MSSSGSSAVLLISQVCTFFLISLSHIFIFMFVLYCLSDLILSLKIASVLLTPLLSHHLLVACTLPSSQCIFSRIHHSYLSLPLPSGSTRSCSPSFSLCQRCSGSGAVVPRRACEC